MQTLHSSLQPQPCGIAWVGSRFPLPTQTCEPPTFTYTTSGLVTWKSSPGLSISQYLVVWGFFGLGWIFSAGKAAGVYGQGSRERTKCSDGIVLHHRQILLRALDVQQTQLSPPPSSVWLERMWWGFPTHQPDQSDLLDMRLVSSWFGGRLFADLQQFTIQGASKLAIRGSMECYYDQNQACLSPLPCGGQTFRKRLKLHWNAPLHKNLKYFKQGDFQ